MGSPTRIGLSIAAVTGLLAAAPARAEEEESKRLSRAAAQPARAIEEAPNALFRFFGAGVYASSAGDLLTTEWGLARPGLSEANPLAAQRAIRISTHALAPAAVWWTTEKLHRSGRRRMALALRIAVTAAYSYAAIHNLRTIHAR